MGRRHLRQVIGVILTVVLCAAGAGQAQTLDVPAPLSAPPTTFDPQDPADAGNPPNAEADEDKPEGADTTAPADDLALVAHVLQIPVYLQNFSQPLLYLRVREYATDLGLLETEADFQEAQFRLVTGLLGTGVSFESLAHPGYFLRHQNLRVKLHKRSETDAFAEAATFIPRPGLAHSAALSFESVTFPNFFIRSRDFQLVISTGVSDQFKEEATFIPVPVVP